ncbi:MAG: PEGA domain-containing protein [Pyrinomonadaceae bacterium]
MIKTFFASIALCATFGLTGISPALAQTQRTPPPQLPEPAPSNLMPADTPIKLRLMQTVSSGVAKVNDTVGFEAIEETRLGDRVVIKQGALAFGTVTVAHPKRSFGRAGQLSINIDYVRLANGDKLALRAVKSGKGGNHTTAMTSAVVASSIVFFPAAPLFFFIKGRNMIVPQGTEITAFVAADTKLSAALFVDPIVTENAPAVDSATGVALATVLVISNPETAEITIDGKFAGTTGSTLKLTAGEHTIKIEKSGYNEWIRTISVGPGASITVNAILEKTAP